MGKLAGWLLEAVRRRGVKRLPVGSVSGFQQAALGPGRIARLWSALPNELRTLGVTTLHTPGLQELAGPSICAGVAEIASISEVIAPVRHVAFRFRLHCQILLFKVREGAFDPTIGEFTVSGTGTIVGKPFKGVEAALSGMAQRAVRGGSAATSGNVGQDLTGDNTGHCE